VPFGSSDVWYQSRSVDLPVKGLPLFVLQSRRPAHSAGLRYNSQFVFLQLDHIAKRWQFALKPETLSN
jgi:hypothetical protein